MGLIITIPDLEELHDDELLNFDNILIVADDNNCINTILNAMKHVSMGIIMGSNHKKYENIIPDVFIFEEYSPDTVKNILSRQKGVYNQCDRSVIDFVLVIDKYTQKIHDDFRYYIDKLPFFGVKTMLCCNESVKIEDIDFQNIDTVVIGTIDNGKLQSIYDTLGDKYFKTFDVFRETYNQYVTKNQALVISNKIKANDNPTMGFVNLSNEIPNLIGSPEILKYCNQIKQK